MIICGWCHSETAPGRCSACGRDPALPWIQRAEDPPTVTEWRLLMRHTRLAQARRDLGPDATADQLADRLGVNVRTLRRWM